MALNQQGNPTSHERRQETGAAIQDLPRLWTSVCLAQEVGENLGGS